MRCRVHVILLIFTPAYVIIEVPKPNGKACPLYDEEANVDE